MSRENVEVVQRAYRAIARGDFDAAWEVTSPGLEYETSPNLPDATVYRGRERVRTFLEEQWEVVWGGLPHVEIERVLDKEGQVVVFLRARGRGSRGEVPLDVRIANVVTVRNGCVVRIQVFPERAQALEAVGLRE